MPLNFAQLATAVGQRLGVSMSDPTSREGAAVRSSLTLRHDQLYRAWLWKDSILHFEVPLNTAYTPTSNYLPTKGHVILPPIIAHVLGVRLGCRSLNVQRPMLYYRANYAEIMKAGIACEFSLLSSCVWEWDYPVPVSLTIYNPADQNTPATVDYLSSSDEVTMIRSSVNPTFSYFNSTIIATTDRIDNVLKSVTQGQYSLQVFGLGLQLFNDSAAGAVQFTIVDYSNPSSPKTTVFVLQIGYGSQIYYGLFGSLSFLELNPLAGYSGTITATPGTINGLYTYYTLQPYVQSTLPPVTVFTMQPADQFAAKSQRIKLIGNPTGNTTQSSETLHVLGKRNVPPFAAETDVCGIAGLEGILVALAMYDYSLGRDERDIPQVVASLTEAVGPTFLTNGIPGGFLAQLIKEEVQQEAFNCRIIPDHGFGHGGYDEPYGSKGWPYGY